MVNSITTTAPTPPPAPSAAAATETKKAPASKQQSSGDTGTDAVHLSSTAQSQLSVMRAALKETTETPAQTATEASGGDRQAQRLIAREAQAAETAKLGK